MTTQTLLLIVTTALITSLVRSIVKEAFEAFVEIVKQRQKVIPMVQESGA